MSWLRDIVSQQTRNWEEFYRGRFQHDKRIRSTHGVNCTGGCSWQIFVKNGIVVWENQAVNYPSLEKRTAPLTNPAAASAVFPFPGACTAPSALSISTNLI